MMKKVMIALAGATILISTSCSLNPEIMDPLSEAPPTSSGAPAPPSISTVYEQLNQLVGQYGYQALQEHSSDELMGPTRGTDWDDFGTWRRLHLHTWAGDHNQINDTWNGLNGALFQTTLVAESGTGLVKAEGQFLRGFFRFLVCDLYGQVQIRPASAAANVIPNVVPRSAIIDSIIAEVEAAIPALPAFNGSNRAQATKEAAYALLAKAYLNRAVYKADPTNPQGPYTFAATDMNKVIQYCDLIAANANIKLNDYYWDNFRWDNGTRSSENIFIRKNGGDTRAGNGANLVWQTCMGGHYNQRPSGWNGFTTLSDFYDSFQDGDERKNDSLEGFTSIVGPTVGFLEGRAYGPVNPSNPRQPGNIGNPVGPLFDRAGNPLLFTRNVSIFFNGEAQGIRVLKFPLEPASINDGGWGSANEFPFLRFADVRLMKAEAILRGGSPTGGENAKSIVNAIQASREGKVDGTVGLNEVLAERGRELYLEGWRRNDLVRFGKFNDPVQERPTRSAGYKVVYPIPLIALSSNPNLKQNFGY
jgi:starch-binding outer membrane protein, SusD/RagB family